MSLDEKNDERRNYLLHEIKHNDLMSEKYKKTCKYLSYVEPLLILASTVTGCVSISAFASLVAIPVGITSSVEGMKIYATTAGTKKYKLIIQKNNKKLDNMVLLGNSMLNNDDVLISKVLIDSYISHDQFVSVKNVLRKYYEIKEETKIPKIYLEYSIEKQWRLTASVLKIYW